MWGIARRLESEARSQQAVGGLELRVMQAIIRIQAVVLSELGTTRELRAEVCCGHVGKGDRGEREVAK